MRFDVRVYGSVALGKGRDLLTLICWVARDTERCPLQIVHENVAHEFALDANLLAVEDLGNLLSISPAVLNVCQKLGRPVDDQGWLEFCLGLLDIDPHRLGATGLDEGKRTGRVFCFLKLGGVGEDETATAAWVVDCFQEAVVVRQDTN